MADTKVCCVCGNAKPLSEFHAVGRPHKDGTQTRKRTCKLCCDPSIADINPVQSYHGPVVSLIDARAGGLTRYFPMEACKRGHIAQRMVSNRLCVVCLSEKTEVRHLKHKDRRNEARVIHRTENLDEARAKGRQRYAENAEECAAKMRLYRQENRDRVKASKKKTYIKTLQAILARNSKRRLQKIGNGGAHTDTDIADIRRMQKDRCANPKCRIKLLGKGHVDHILAVTRGGSDDRRNLQLLCESCNIRKYNKDAIAFMQEEGFLL